MFLHHLHLGDDMSWDRISDGWLASLPSFWSTWGIATFQPFLVSSVCAGAFLVLILSVVPCVPLTQLLFQIMILFGETFHYCREGLDLPLQGSRSWLVSLNVVGGHHRASKYHATLCPRSNSMANLSHKWGQLMMPKKSPVSHTILLCSKQCLHNKERKPYKEHQCGAD